MSVERDETSLAGGFGTVAGGSVSRIPRTVRGRGEGPAEPASARLSPDPEFQETLSELQGHLARIHRVAAETCMAQSMTAEAIVHLEAACRFDRSDAEYANELGVLRYVTGDDEGALAAFEEALRRDPANAAASFNRGMALFGLGRHEEAEAALARSAICDDGSAETWNNLGVVRFQLGRTDEARRCFEKCLALDPANTDATANLSALA